jgi:hypothetical protein
MVARFLPLSPGDPTAVAGYTLRARLGSGGMGTVYLSFTRGGIPVALKIVKREFADDPEFRRRFKREVEAVRRVQGQYTAPVLDADPDAPIPWLATAYIPGPSLQTAITENGGPFPPFSVFRLLAGAAEGIAAVHGAGLIHRDLKPANVLLAPDGPRVIDFGIAHAADASALTGAGQVVGTPAFLAPEQISGHVTTATDVWALGHLVVFAATGRAAFGDGLHSVLIYRILNEPPMLDDCPDAFRPIAERCLSKDPAGRPSVDEVIEYAHAAFQGQTMRVMDEPWLPRPVAETLRGYDTRTAQPAPAASGAATGGNRAVSNPAAASFGPSMVPSRMAAGPGDGMPSRPNGSPAAPARRSRRWVPIAAVVAAAVIAGVYLAGLANGSRATPSSAGTAAATQSPAASRAASTPPTASAAPASASATGPAAAAGPAGSEDGFVAEYSGDQFVMPGEDCEVGGTQSDFEPSDVLFTSTGPRVTTDNNVGNGDLVLTCNDGNNNGNTDLVPNNIAIAPVSGSPGAVACDTAIQRQPIAGDILLAQLTPGAQFCIVGGPSNGQLVLLTLDKKASPSYDLTWTATAWAMPAQSS